ncbi:hypothetical protein [Actinophytocola sp.]|uniref:Rv2732c family membrane protein n=1 Tax=Actinophytocola sp. TaxID=1872138 RepID=UPI002D7EFB05|nr:hypothetical protein [Actinophytocola sp.]HET9140125.1 hypothetical protein [Actinophytocola sp.]
MTGGEPPELAGLREEIDEVERTTVRTVDLGVRGLVIAVAVFVLMIGEILPWMDGANGLDVLLGQHDATGKASTVPRVFAITSIAFGILASMLALMTRRWRLTWVCALGGWLATVTGILAIWSRQSGGGSGPGPGLVIAVIATVVIAALWFRTAWSRS